MDLSGRCVGSSYILVQPIGQGATGTVWRGVDRASGEPVAVKLLHESLLRQPKLVTRFVQERTILLMLRHRNVVRVRDLFSVGETLGLVMDLVGGGSLRDHLRERHTVPAGEAARLAAQVAAALAEAHELGIIHRDLKPDNILLAGDGERPDTRLTDFGVARILNTPSLTTPNAVVGTPHYMAPEAFHGATASPATDVYALGVLLYEMVCGRPPYDSDAIPDLMRRHMEGNPRRRPGIPDPLWDVIMQCMALKPRLRPSAAELVADLTDVSRRFAGVPALPRPEPTARTGPSGSFDGEVWYPAPADPPASRGAAPPAPSRIDPPPAAGAAPPAFPGADPPAPPRTDPSASPRTDPPAPPRTDPPRTDPPRTDLPRTGPHGALPPAGPISVVPQPRRPQPRNQPPAWRWARPGASLMVAAMLASAVATTAWHLGRAGADEAAPTAPQTLAAPPTTRPAGRVATRPPRAAARATDPGRATRPAADRGGEASPRTPATPHPAAKAAPKAGPTRSPQPEARPYGPWQCRQSFAFDMASRMPVAPRPCQMLGRDIQYQAGLTAPGGGRGSISVALQDAGTGRTVAGPRTCAGLTFTGDAATRTCGPAAASPARGHDYAVVMSYRYERDGRTVASTSRGRAFRW